MKLSPKQYGMIVSDLLTAYIHISLYPDIMFTLNGLGYLGLLGAYLVPMDILQKNRKLIWWALFGYTALTIVLWVIMGDKNFVAGTDSAIGFYAKAAEVFLMIFLWADKES